MALKEADKFHNKHPEQSQPRITQVGHSLGGTLAQIQSYRFKQEGVTFNAYGAAALNGIPKGGDKVINYALASDVVSAAGPHYGKMVILAQNHELMGMWAAGYNTSINTFASQATQRHLLIGGLILSAILQVLSLYFRSVIIGQL